MGTLGLAWTGDLKNAGGVCEKNGVSEESVLTDLKSVGIDFLGKRLRKRKPI